MHHGAPCLFVACIQHGAPCLFVARMTCLTVTSCTGIEDEQDDALPQHQTQMRYDDQGIDSEDDFIDDDLGEGIQGQQPRRARGKGRTAGVHSQAVQVCHTLLQCMPCQYRHDCDHCPQQCTSSFVKVTHHSGWPFHLPIMQSLAHDHGSMHFTFPRVQEAFDIFGDVGELLEMYDARKRTDTDDADAEQEPDFSDEEAAETFRIEQVVLVGFPLC